VLALALTIVILASVTLQLQPLRHVNPEQLQWRLPAGLDMLTLYGVVFKSIASFEFEEALGNISLINEASIPENLRYVASRVNSLLENTIRSLNETKTYIDIAWGYFNRSSFNEARAWLGRAEGSLREASISYTTLRDVARQVSTLGIPVGRFIEELAGVEDAIKRLEEEIEALRLALDEARQVIETRVTLRVNATRVNVGDWIEVRGRLVDARGAPLDGRIITVHVGSTAYNVVTGGEGFYSVTSRVTEYRRYVSVYAEFTPAGGDRVIYAYSKSDAITLEVFYITPRLEVTLSKHEALPLDNVTLTVSSEPPTCLKVESLLVNRTLCLDRYSVASLNFTIDPGLAEGVYDVRVNVIPAGLIGPAGESVQLKVYRLNPALNVKAPGYFIAGISGSVRVDVEVDSRIGLCVEGLTCLYGVGSSLNFKVGAPITYARDSVKLVVVVEPLDPRFRDSTLVLEARVYNPLAMVTLLALAVTVIAIPSIAILGSLKPRGYPRGAPPVEEAVGAPGRFEGSREELQSLLEELSHLTGRLYGVSLRASDTFREYMSRLSTASRGLVEVLREAFMLLERALYGKPEGARALLDRVFMLLRKVIGMLRGALG